VLKLERAYYVFHQKRRPARAARTNAEAALTTELSVHMWMLIVESSRTTLIASTSAVYPALGFS